MTLEEIIARSKSYQGMPVGDQMICINGRFHSNEDLEAIENRKKAEQKAFKKALERLKIEREKIRL